MAVLEGASLGEPSVAEVEVARVILRRLLRDKQVLEALAQERKNEPGIDWDAVLDDLSDKWGLEL